MMWLLFLEVKRVADFYGLFIAF